MYVCRTLWGGTWAAVPIEVLPVAHDKPGSDLLMSNGNCRPWSAFGSVGKFGGGANVALQCQHHNRPSPAGLLTISDVTTINRFAS